MDLFDDPVRSRNLAMALGVLGGIITAIAVGISNTPVLVIGVVVLMASGITWAIRGVKEDQAAQSE